MSSLMLRRTFLALAGASPLTLAGLTRAAAQGESDAALEASLRRLVFAVGPWPEDDRATAEDFFARFWAAVPASEPYRRDAALLASLSERFPPGAHAVDEVDLAGLPPEERELLEQLADGLYDLLEIRAYVGGEPPYGVCETDRSRYLEAPGSG